MAKNLELSLLMDFYGQMLTDKQREVMEYYYNDDLSLGEIAANEGISRQGVRDAVKRAEFQLLDMEDRLGLFRKFREIQAGLEQIQKSARAVSSFNDQFVFSREAAEELEKIQETARRLSDSE